MGLCTTVMINFLEGAFGEGSLPRSYYPIVEDREIYQEIVMNDDLVLSLNNHLEEFYCQMGSENKKVTMGLMVIMLCSAQEKQPELFRLSDEGDLLCKTVRGEATQ